MSVSGEGEGKDIAASGESRCKGPVVGRSPVRATPERRESMRLEVGADWVGGAGRDKPLRPRGLWSFILRPRQP